MLNNLQLPKENFMRWIRGARQWLPPLKTMPWDVALTYVVLLTAVVLLLSGCQTQPQQPCERPAPITRPVLSEPLPSVAYSLTAQKNIETWQKKLAATSTTSRP